MKIQSRVYQAGVLTIGTGESGVDRNGYDITGSLALYESKTVESLFLTAKHYPTVIRPNGKEEKGEAYTMRKAKFDFENHAA